MTQLTARVVALAGATPISSILVKLSAIALLAVTLGVTTMTGAQAASKDEAQETVDAATLALRDLTNNGAHPTVKILLRDARAVMIFPRILKGGIGIGGEGGRGVMLARSADGRWSYPSFYGMGSFSIGLQLGVQETRMLIIIMTDEALEKLMDGTFKFGGDLSAVAINDGLDKELSTTTSRDDIYYYAETERGLFAGISLEGSDIDWQRKTSRNYYGEEVNPTEILIDQSVSNPEADGLRRMLDDQSAGQTIRF